MYSIVLNYIVLYCIGLYCTASYCILLGIFIWCFSFLTIELTSLHFH